MGWVAEKVEDYEATTLRGLIENKISLALGLGSGLPFRFPRDWFLGPLSVRCMIAAGGGD